MNPLNALANVSNVTGLINVLHEPGGFAIFVLLLLFVLYITQRHEKFKKDIGVFVFAYVLGLIINYNAVNLVNLLILPLPFAMYVALFVSVVRSFRNKTKSVFSSIISIVTATALIAIWFSFTPMAFLGVPLSAIAGSWTEHDHQPMRLVSFRRKLL